MRIIELVIDESEGVCVEAMSNVEHPAIESGFVMLGEQKLSKMDVQLQLDEEKRILLGPALIPNKLIYRMDPDMGEYYIYFSKKTVEQAAHLFLQSGNQSNTTLEHQAPVEGCTVVETWLKEDEVHDKSVKYNLDAPIGSWIIAQKVDNDEVWADAKAGKIKGFSIEAYFADKMAVQQKKSIEEKIKDIWNG